MHRLLLIVLVAAVALGCEADYLIWIPHTRSADQLYRFVKNGKAGFIDAKGRVVIPPVLPRTGNYGSEFHNGLLEVSLNEGKYVDARGKLVLDPKLYRGWDFSEGLAAAMRNGEHLWGYIDTSGRFAITPRFATVPDGYVHSFSDGLAMIEVKGKFGFIDRSGQFVVPPEFLDATDFADGMARVVVEGPCVYFPEEACCALNPRVPGLPSAPRYSAAAIYPPCKFTYINRRGRPITQQRFDNGRNFSEGLAPVQVGTRWGFIDRSGSWVISPKFEDALPFSSGLARIYANGKYGYADRSGQIVILPQFVEADSFSEGFAVVTDQKGHNCYIDTHGQQSFARRFAHASPFFKGLAHVKLSKRRERYAYIDTAGHTVFHY